MGQGRVDFFISHAGRDRAWAEWVAWHLAEAGYTVELDVWDWQAGQNFVTKMSDALDGVARVVALYSSAYFQRARYTTEEWSASMLHLPGVEGRLVPLRIEEVPTAQIPAVLRPLLSHDLFGLDEQQARQVLVKAVSGPGRPDVKPVFPGPGSAGALSRLGGSGPRLPVSLPHVWNVRARNPGFTGRDSLLVAVRERLLSGDRAVVQALRGMGGVGKTQLAAEYAHRFAGDYDIIWWINADQPGLIGEQIASLGAELGCAPPGTDTAAAVRSVMAELRGRDRWLLIFDNANTSDEIADWLPGGATGHVLITSRASGWDEIATSVEIDVFTPAESAAVLHARVPGLTDKNISKLAEALGHLPLAVTQAARYLAETGMSADEYLEMLSTRAATILSQGHPPSYPLSLAAVTRLAADRLAAEYPAAAELLASCAFLAPEPVPAALLAAAAGFSSGSPPAQPVDTVAFRKLLSAIRSSALARIEYDSLQMHRLTQAILRDQLTAEQAMATRTRAEAILAAGRPGDLTDPGTWPAWAGILPHLLDADLAATDNAALRDLACDAARYLLKRGDNRSSHNLASQLHLRWRDLLGPDDGHALSAARILAGAIRQMGGYHDARLLDEDTLARRRRAFGEDHPDTLRSANNLANDLRALGESAAARDLDQDTLDRRRRTLGDDHVDTLQSANGLGNDLRALGEYEAARDLAEVTLERRRRTLGDDHPDTLWSASYLAADLRALGEVQAARKLDEATLRRRRRTLGDDHPDTLWSAGNLAADLRALGEVQAARKLDEATLRRRRRTLGDDHPDTLWSAGNLAADLRALGEVQAADDFAREVANRRREQKDRTVLSSGWSGS